MAKITYAGHSAVFVATDSGKSVAIDPWLEGNPKCPDVLKNPSKLDCIVLTHGHSDHTGGVPALATKLKSRVCATYELAVLIQKDGVPGEQIVFMNKGGSTELSDLKLNVTLTNAFHSSSYDAKDGKTYYAGEPCGVVLRLENGKTIYHCGDTCLFSDMSLIGERFKPDLMLVPIGDCFTMGPEDAARAVGLVKPKFVIPIHYATFDALTGTSEEFSAALRGGTSAEVVVLRPGETFDL